MASKEIERGKGTRGRGAEGKQNVAVMAESTPLEDIETGKKEKHVRYFKARVLDSHQSEGINGVVRDCMEDDAIVFSDKSTSYVDISDLVELHVTEKSDAKTTKETLKWVHIAISNAKRTLLGNYHKIKRKYLQLYLNEFIYKSSNPQPIGFSGILLAKRQNSFYCTYFLHNRNVADTKSPYPIKRLEVIRWFNQKSMVFNQSLS